MRVFEKSPQKTSSTRADFWLLLALFVAFRLLTLLLLKPGGFIRDWSDFDTYLGIAQLSDYGLYPYLHFWLEWPPLVPWLMVGAYRLSLLIPVWTEDPRLWFVTILGAVFVLFEAGNFWLVYRLARRLLTGRADILRVLAMYALLFPPVYAMLGFFDGMALFFILFSLDLLLADRFKGAAMAAAVGTLVKLTPIITAGVAAWLLWHRLKPDRRRAAIAWLGYVATLAGALLALLAPFLLIAPQWLAAHARAVLGRSSWETGWAALEGYFGFGQLAGNRLNPAETAFAAHPASLPWLWISLAFAALYLAAFFLRPKDTSPRRVLAFGGLTITLFLLYSKGYSPQFLVLVLPFIILLLPNGAGLGYALALTALNVLEQPVYFVMLPKAHWLLTAVVWLRFALFAALAVEFWVQVSGFRFRGWRVARVILLAAVFIWMASLLPRAAGEYRAAQSTQQPVGALVLFLQTVARAEPQPLVITTRPAYRQLYPYLHRSYRLRLADDTQLPGAPTPQQIAKTETMAWVWVEDAAAVGQKFADLGAIAADYLPGDGNRLLLTDFSGDGVAPPLMASAENGMELAGASVRRNDDALTVQLFWHAAKPGAADYTVFTQLLSAGGQYIAGHDGQPAAGANPTAGWPANALVSDAHRIDLPPDLPPGEYRLVAGMYDASGARLPFFAPDGSPLADGAIPVKILTLP